ncbi:MULTISPECIES: IclR family transcriptional regulator C-terminal domain-containing protein [Streptacidiphilus]|uniref:IclR family transcriptional regulator C-terminal domain-containing protein n=1 Tax=Streptacidiphilus cavernicola TaxID=3342716 RepID=A0ABV6UHT1_9ACTN|nr:IclR family transcriptional regulator C-terminal domain-containing protein [Streptacidiphilus jeojiense]
MPQLPPLPPPAEAVGPLIRGIAVLRELTAAPGGRRSPGELARSTALARSTVDRIVATLARIGYVRTEGREVVLAPPLMELGNAYLLAVGLPDLLGPHADRLADALDESVSIAVPDRDGIRFVHQATRRRSLSLSFRIGDLLPADRTAPGPLFAADRGRPAHEPHDWPALPPPSAAAGASLSFEQRTEQAGRDGWSVDDQLIEPGLVALAAPVRDPAGRQVCAVSVVSHTSRHTAEDLRAALLPQLLAATGEMELELRHGPPPTTESERPTVAWTADAKQEAGSDFVESLARGLSVLTAFGSGRSWLTLSAVAQATGLPRATARRALITLHHLGYIAQEGREFGITPQVLDLGFAPLSRLTLPQLAQPHLRDLCSRLHDSASMAVLDGTDIRYTARAASERIMAVRIDVGTRLPAEATAMGQVLLAGQRGGTDRAELAALLDRVAAQGYAMVSDELEHGLRSIAVAVRDRAGRTVAAVNAAMHAQRNSPEQTLADVLPALREAAGRIEADLRVAGRFAAVQG